jgi:hypothetical protein
MFCVIVDLFYLLVVDYSFDLPVFKLIESRVNISHPSIYSLHYGNTACFGLLLRF